MGTATQSRERGSQMIIRKFWLGASNPTPSVFVEFSEGGEVGWSPVNLETARQLAAQLNQAIARADRHLDYAESQRRQTTGPWDSPQETGPWGFGSDQGTTDGPLGAAERGE